MKKLMWTGLIIELSMLVVIFILVFMHNPVLDIVSNFFAAGMFACIISSFFVNRQKNQSGNIKYKR